MYRELKTFKRTRPKDSIGKWVIELKCGTAREYYAGWRRLSFGIYKIKTDVGQGESYIGFKSVNIKGFRLSWLFWLPFDCDGW